MSMVNEENYSQEKELLKDNIYLSKELQKSKCLLINERESSLKKDKEIEGQRQEQQKLLKHYDILEKKLEKSLLVVSKNENQITKLKSNLEDKHIRLLKTKEALEKKQKDLADLELKYKELQRNHTKLKESHEKLQRTIPFKLMQEFWTLKKRVKGVFKA